MVTSGGVRRLPHGWEVLSNSDSDEADDQAAAGARDAAAERRDAPADSARGDPTNGVARGDPGGNPVLLSAASPRLCGRDRRPRPRATDRSRGRVAYRARACRAFVRAPGGGGVRRAGAMETASPRLIVLFDDRHSGRPRAGARRGRRPSRSRPPRALSGWSDRSHPNQTFHTTVRPLRLHARDTPHNVVVHRTAPGSPRTLVVGGMAHRRRERERPEFVVTDCGPVVASKRGGIDHHATDAYAIIHHGNTTSSQRYARAYA